MSEVCGVDRTQLGGRLTQPASCLAYDRWSSGRAEGVAVRVFVSYRRDDSAAAAGRLCDLLRARLGADDVFHDVEAVRPGETFTDAIRAALARSDAVVVVIGPQWLTISGADESPRLEDLGDYVREEIREALARSKRVIPVLVGGATMPEARQLPDDISALAVRQAMSLRDESWTADAGRLVTLLAGRFDRRIRRTFVAAVALVVAVMGASVIVLRTRSGSDSRATTTTLTGPTTSFDATTARLDTCPTPRGAAWRPLNLVGTGGGAASQWLFRVTGGAYRAVGSDLWEVVIDIEATNQHPDRSDYHYPFYAVVIEAERANPQCFQVVAGEARVDPGHTSEALVGFIVTTKPTSTMTIDVNAPGSAYRMDLAPSGS